MKIIAREKGETRGIVGHTTQVYVPYSFRTVAWVPLRPTSTRQVKVLRDLNYGFIMSFSGVTRKSNRLPMLLQWQYFLLGYLKALSACPAWV